MKNKAFYPFENKIMDKRVNIIETDLRNENRRCINEVNRLPVKYSVGNDYLYTYRIFDIKKKYINREITKEQYEILMRIVRDKMNIAIDMLSSVKVTLGPKGENVIINQSLCSPFITNDGVTIASNIESDDIVVNTILERAKEASIKTLETAGDGTTTTLVLLEELYKEGVKLVDNKVNPIIIREQLNTESQKVVNLLDKYSKKPTKKELLDIAVTASNDIEIGKNICNAYLKVKDKDLIDIKETNNRNTTINYVKGYSFDTCIASYYYFKENVIKMDDVYVLITNKVINEIYEIEDILNIIINDNKNLVIIADDYGENLVNQMVSMYQMLV